MARNLSGADKAGLPVGKFQDRGRQSIRAKSRIMFHQSIDAGRLRIKYNP